MMWWNGFFHVCSVQCPNWGCNLEGVVSKSVGVCIFEYGYISSWEGKHFKKGVYILNRGCNLSWEWVDFRLRRGTVQFQKGCNSCWEGVCFMLRGLHFTLWGGVLQVRRGILHAEKGCSSCWEGSGVAHVSCNLQHTDSTCNELYLVRLLWFRLLLFRLLQFRLLPFRLLQFHLLTFCLLNFLVL